MDATSLAVDVSSPNDEPADQHAGRQAEASPRLQSVRSQVAKKLAVQRLAVNAFADAKSHHKLFSRDRLRDLKNPMREHRSQCASASPPCHTFPRAPPQPSNTNPRGCPADVVNMWKIYNHHYLSHRSAAKVLNLFFYSLYVYVMT